MPRNSFKISHTNFGSKLKQLLVPRTQENVREIIAHCFKFVEPFVVYNTQQLVGGWMLFSLMIMLEMYVPCSHEVKPSYSNAVSKSKPLQVVILK